MGVIHRYKGQFEWEGVSLSHYPPEKEMKGVSVRWLIGPAEKAPNFALRYFEIEPGGWTSLDQHAHDHGVVILRGRGQVLLGEEEADWSNPVEVAFGDVVYISPHEVHQFKNTGDEPMGFLCVIPPR
jgi:quercetin dioxygenase-like cupin family protein